jgi:toxin ParE1/3/4
MAFNLIVRPEAEQDLSEAFRWYEERRKGLGHDFLLQVYAGFRARSSARQLPRLVT